MATVESIVEDLNAVASGIATVDSKLDDIRALVAALQAGSVTQEQIDALAAKVAEVKTATAAIVAEANAIE